MKKTLLTCFIACLPISMGYAQGIRKDVGEYAGKRCNTPKKGSGVVAGFYSGSTDNPMVSSAEFVPINRYRCFQTMSECKGWLYTMESLYGSPTPETKLCTKF